MIATVGIDLPPRTGSIARGRWFVRAAARSWSVPPDAAADAVLCASECVTNAVLHGQPPLNLEVAAGEGVLRVEVHDASPTPLPPVTPRTGRTERGGRGLPIIDTMSSAWGARTSDAGKTVWFEIATPTAAPRPEENSVERATGEILAATSPDVVIDVLAGFVQGWGGTCTQPGLRPGHELPVDLALGTGPPLVPSCDPSSPGRRALEEWLPQLVEDARRMVNLLWWVAEEGDGR